MLFLESVAMGRWPVIMAISDLAISSASLLSAPAPMEEFTTTFVILGIW
jgi:hypothetical protein